MRDQSLKRFACEIRIDNLGGGMVESPTGVWVHLATHLDEIDLAELRGAARLAMDLGLATGHADNHEALLAHCREQKDEIKGWRRDWQ